MREENVAAHRTELQALAAKLGIHDLFAVYIGHASPDTVKRLTQGLLDAGRLPPPDGTPACDRIRTMMADYGLGFDCAGYTQQAFLSARGMTRHQVGFASGAEVESLSDLPSKGFARVAPENARPGDIVVLDAPGGSAGHRLVVYARRELTAGEVADKAKVSGLPLVAGKVVELTLDSSYGSGGDPTRGGVSQKTFVYDAESKTWQSHAAPTLFRAAPYSGDTLRGVYHLPARP